MTTQPQPKQGNAWFSKRGWIQYVPPRYQALVAQITAALLYFNILKTVFGVQDFNVGSCGSLFRPVVEDRDWGRPGWFWNIGSAQCDRMMSGRLWELLFTFVGLAICGVVLRRAERGNS